MAEDRRHPSSPMVVDHGLERTRNLVPYRIQRAKQALKQPVSLWKLLHNRILGNGLCSCVCAARRWMRGWRRGGSHLPWLSMERRGKRKSLEMSGSLHPANRNEADCQSAAIVSTVNPAWVSADKEQLLQSNEKRGNTVNSEDSSDGTRMQRGKHSRRMSFGYLHT